MILKTNTICKSNFKYSTVELEKRICIQDLFDQSSIPNQKQTQGLKNGKEKYSFNF
jgi:hypothetical protein